MKSKMLVYTPFTGLGLYGGFRGNRWLRNRIAVFKRFVMASLLNQTDQDWVLWISWREEEMGNPYVIELGYYLDEVLGVGKSIFTFHGICFWDDKYEPKEARERLFWSMKQTLPELLDYVPDCDEVQILLQPSDDMYDTSTIAAMKKVFATSDVEGIGYTKGYLINYTTKEVLEYNPKTNPPFFAYRIPRNIFADPGKHMTYISTKEDEGQYPKGTPYPSHEWIPNAFRMGYLSGRGFMVGTHGENISTHFNHPYGGEKVSSDVLVHFSVQYVEPIKLPISIRKWIMRQLPYRWQRKLRYIFGEMMYNRVYNFLRS